jgi:outer membrane lipoprotein SlyB
MSNELSSTPGATPVNSSRHAWFVGGALAVAGLATATGIAMRPGSLASPPAAEPVAQVAAAAPAPAAVRAPVKQAAAKPVADVCKHCGVVESVQAITRKGDANGVGAVAGGVLGAVVGNQMGKGTGRDAMTVIGAVGGGLAGHEVEKRAKSTTVYAVRVRLDDGSTRTFEQSSAPAAGARVVVDGNSVKLAGAHPAG